MTSIAEFLVELRRLDVQVSIEGDRLRCSAPEGTLTAELQQQLRDRKLELLTFLQEVRSQPPAAPILPAPPKLLYPLSFAQQRLWFLAQLAPDNPFYNVPAAIWLRGSIDFSLLERSFNVIVQRHAALRTRFAAIDAQPMQKILAEMPIALSVLDLRSIPSTEREAIAQQFAAQEAGRSFNLSDQSLIRVTLLQFDLAEAMLLLTLHHIVADGWSLGVLMRELAIAYEALVEGRSPDLPLLPIQYTDFSEWQRNRLQGEFLEGQLAYWRSQLQDLPTLELPLDRPRPAVQSYRGETVPLHYAQEITDGLTNLSQQAGASLFMTLLAAFSVLLHRYTEQTDIAIGSPIANRDRSELEGLIGFFVNSLVLRIDLSGNPTFRDLVERVRNVAIAAYAHQELPFEKLVEELDPDRDLSRNPLFQVAFALQNAPMQPLELPDVTLEPAPLQAQTTRFDLEVHLWEPSHGLHGLWQAEAGLSGFISYSTDLFDRATIDRLIAHFQILLAGIVANPDAPLLDLPILTAAEQHAAWNQTATQPLDLRFHEIFERHAQQTPDAVAIVTAAATLTYAQLNQQADRLAQTLRQKGVQPDVLVGLCVERSVELAIGILGILKAGGAYVPLDPSYPIDRLEFMLADTQVKILLTQSGLLAKLPSCEAEILCLDRPWPEAISPARSRPTPDNLAYVIYTSGSTGVPKGVLITQRGLSNVVTAQRSFGATRSSRILQLSSLSFDASVFEIALAFGSGSTLYIPPKAAQMPGVALIQFLQAQAITHALITPAVLSVLPAADLPDLQTLITGGELASQSVVDRWSADRRFFNAYGPTEATIWAAMAELHLGDSPRSIGQPIANTQIHLLDRALRPVPIGIAADLYIGGAGVARGYLDRPDLTAERFVEVAGIAGRLYKTGDRARYRADGSIEFLGRVDDQVKIRGFRVELGEIAARLQQHPAVQAATAIAAEERLIAYFRLDRGQLHQATALQAQQIQSWQLLYDQTYQRDAPDSDFNITGWISSYTGQPIPIEQMHEWVSDRVDQILALQPQRILEIGCGTGLLLFQLAPQTQEYWATDFSTAALQSIAKRRGNGIDRQINRSLPQVRLLNRLATDFTDIPPAHFDLVILNSIVQYFPNADYLMQVLAGAIASVAPGGVLFLGDLRSLPLLTAFHAWAQFVQADADLTQIEFRQRVDRARFEDPELAIDPGFFDALRDRFPQIKRVQIRLARGRAENEMTQFRYHVLLHIDDEARSKHSETPANPAIDWQDWTAAIDPAAVAKQLCQTQPEAIGIRNVPNRRISAALQVADWLTQTAPKTVGQLRDPNGISFAGRLTPTGIDPQDWWDLEALPYRVEVRWSRSQLSAYDLLIVRQDVAVDWPEAIDRTDVPTADMLTADMLTNEPLQAEFARQLVPQLRSFLQQTLPDYMIPAAFVPIETFPLTPSGKLDQRALPPIDRLLPAATPARSSTESPTKSPTESTLIEIWQELLRLKQVGVHDRFFELGGHSLLATQMASRVRDVLGVELPLRTVFEAPTIAQLAQAIEILRQTAPAAPPPAIVRLDRAAHRRLRPTPNLEQPSNFEPPSSLEQPLTSPHPPLAGNLGGEAAWSPLVPIALGSGTPFFCVHPILGVVFPYLELAHHLGDRSFYGLQPMGMDGKQAPLTQIEAIAACYIRAIQTVQPNGPYLIGGWSFGGLVAFEMAQQLTQANQKVALLAILDTPAPIATAQPSIAQTVQFLGKTLQSSLPFLLDYGAIVTTLARSKRQGWLSLWQWLAIAHLLPQESQLRLLDEAAIVPLLKIFYANSRAAYQYAPQKYPHKLTLFKAAEQSNYFGKAAAFGWESLADRVQIHAVPGNHLSLLKPPHVQVLGKQLQQCLQEAIE